MATNERPVCAGCGANLAYETGLYGPPGWYDPAAVDINCSGSWCADSSGPHEPAPPSVEAVDNDE